MIENTWQYPRYVRFNWDYKIVHPFIKKIENQWHILYEGSGLLSINDYTFNMTLNFIQEINDEIANYNGEIIESKKIKVLLPFGCYRNIPFHRSKILTHKKVSEIKSIVLQDEKNAEISELKERLAELEAHKGVKDEN